MDLSMLIGTRSLCHMDTSGCAPAKGVEFNCSEASALTSTITCPSSPSRTSFWSTRTMVERPYTEPGVEARGTGFCRQDHSQRRL
jgi:hypothetical protein